MDMRFIVFLLTFSTMFWSSSARSHDWYPTACCNEQDCRPVNEGEIQSHPDGYIHGPTGTVIRRGDYHMQQHDDLTHVCVVDPVLYDFEGAGASPYIPRKEGRLCVFFPGGGA
ncbi:MAG: hypothetical protein AAF416_14440 [Pseudomonadota bacterium]